MSKHAILSPSAASRWLVCTPSARLELKFPETKSDASSEGTLAHSLGELLIRHRLNMITKTKYKKDLAAIQENEYYEHAMMEYMEQYAVYVIEQYHDARADTSDALLFLEQKLDMSEYVPEGYGTGDVVIIADRVLDFIDLKYGKGVPVFADNNKQMMLYALGALNEFGYMYSIDIVRMTIYQPRLDSISTFEMKVSELLQWAENELKPRAALAFAGEGEFSPGEACRFCKVKATCKANADYNLELAKYDFQEGVLLSDADIADILDRADNFTKWLTAIEEHALYQAVHNNKKWPGYKLVEGRSNRIYADETKVADTLKENGFTDDVIYTKKLLGITAMEKAISKPSFNAYLTPLIIKPAGKPTLVHESDKRPEYNSAEGAAKEFEEVLNDELM